MVHSDQVHREFYEEYSHSSHHLAHLISKPPQQLTPRIKADSITPPKPKTHNVLRLAGASIARLRNLPTPTAIPSPSIAHVGRAEESVRTVPIYPDHRRIRWTGAELKSCETRRS